MDPHQGSEFILIRIRNATLITEGKQLTRTNLFPGLLRAVCNIVWNQVLRSWPGFEPWEQNRIRPSRNTGSRLDLISSLRFFCRCKSQHSWYINTLFHKLFNNYKERGQIRHFLEILIRIRQSDPWSPNPYNFQDLQLSIRVFFSLFSDGFYRCYGKLHVLVFFHNKRKRKWITEEPFSPYRLEQTVSRTPTQRKFSVYCVCECVRERECVCVRERERENPSPLIVCSRQSAELLHIGNFQWVCGLCVLVRERECLCV